MEPCFSTFKRTDSHTVRCRPTRKDVVDICERIFRNGPFHVFKMSIESHYNQTRNQMSTFTKILVADKDKVKVIKLLEKPEETTTKMLPCLT